MADPEPARMKRTKILYKAERDRDRLFSLFFPHLGPSVRIARGRAQVAGSR
jgi:hypothetical protein